MNVLPAVVGGYVAASYFFLKNPHYLHHKIRRCRPAKIIAHRGGAGEGYENTLAAFRAAVELGCDMLELDVQLTKDSVVVVSHDNDLSRLTGRSGTIQETNYEDLPLIQPKIPIDFDPPGSYCDLTASEKERRLARLEDVLAEFPAVQLNIDIKQPSLSLVLEVNRIIVAHQAQGRVVWGSFDKNTTELCYRTNPDIGLFFSFREFFMLLLLFFTGLLPFVSLKETHLELPMLSVFMAENFGLASSRISFGKLPHLVLRIFDWILMQPALFTHLRKRGIVTYLWVLNREADFARAKQLGVDGIMTDYPTRLKSYINNNQLQQHNHKL